MNFILVSTVYNEIDRLDATIRDIEAQTLRPSEIIITDAGSTDGTFEKLTEWAKTSAIPIKILQEKGCNVARGRNLAIAAAQHALIASTDFGCRFHPQWLESIVMPFENHPDVKVVGGAFTIQTDNPVQDETPLPPLSRDSNRVAPTGSHNLTRSTLASRSDYIIQNGYPVVMDPYFSVSSRSIAYFKEVWQQCGGYPEWLTLAGDDTIFWRKVKKLGVNYLFVDKPYVYWLRHKTNKAFAKEAYRYGLGDGEAHINVRNAMSHIMETLLRYILILIVVASPLLSSISPWLLSPAIPALIGLRSYRNVYINWKKHKSPEYNAKVLLNAFLQVELSRAQYLKGFFKGYFRINNDIKNGRTELKALGIH
jgi:glycosyltransferase involved in cell wall biosynthesis